MLLDNIWKKLPQMSIWCTISFVQNVATKGELMSHWEWPFCGLTLTPKDKVRIHEEIFHLITNSDGGFTHDEVYTMPVYLRYFYLKMLIDKRQREQKQSEDAQKNQNKPQGVVQKPF